MTLQDLLDELAKGMLRDRSDLMSGPADYMWSDETLVGYINEAESLLARKGLVIRDASTPAVVEFTLQTGITQYTLHPSVVAVISAKIVGDTGDLSRSGHSAFSSYQTPDTLYFDPNDLGTLTPGKPLAFSTDEQLDIASGKSGLVSMRMYPEPTADYHNTVVQLRVVRKPINTLSVDDLNASPEVPEDYHLGLLDWAAYRALRNIDSDVGAVDKANAYKTEFNEMVMQARRDSLRKLFTPLQWGFGRSGFTWES